MRVERSSVSPTKPARVMVPSRNGNEQMFKKAPIGFAAIILVGAALAVGVKVDAGGEYDAARRHYVDASRAEANQVARNVQNSLRSIYENVRTLTLLPSVRQIDRHATNLTPDSLETIQQVYNNLASNV